MAARRVGALCAALFLLGCPDEETSVPGPEPIFPADYAATYVEVRNCRSSGDHDLNRIRILAAPEALAPYNDHAAPFPTGAVLLKEEFEFDDMSCAGPLKQWTVMVRQETGSSAETLDWHWQRVDASRGVVEDNVKRCYACHSQCTEGVGNYDYTCAMP